MKLPPFPRSWSLPAALSFALAWPVPAPAAWIPDGTPVCLAPGEQRLTSLAPDGAGGVFIAWTDLAASAAFVQRLGADGDVAPGWPAGGRAIATVEGNARDPVVASDGAGGLFVAWCGEAWPTSFEVRTNLYVQRLDATGSVRPGWPATGVFVAFGADDQIQRTGTALAVSGLGVDGLGGCLVTYSLSNYGCHGGYCPTASSHRARVLAGSGALGSLLALLDCADGAAAFGATLPDGAGGALALLRTDCGTTAGLVHSTPGGTTTAPIATTAGWVPFALAPDGAGGGYALLSESGAGVRLRRLTAAGTPVPGWSAGGLAVPAPSGAACVAAPAGASGVGLCWAAGGGLHALRITPDGSLAPSWPAAGVPLASAPAVPFGHAAVHDGTGGMFVAWQDAREPGYSTVNLFASHVLGDGSLASGVPPSGFPLCLAPGRQDPPRIVATEPGAAIVAWTDARGPDVNLFAQRLPLDQAVPALASLVTARWEDGAILLEWRLAGGESRATLQRRTEASGWDAIATLDADGEGRVAWRDEVGATSGRYGYRLDLGGGRLAGETWVEAPGLALSVRGFVPNPSGGAPVVDFTLARAAPASLELLDVAGRRVIALDLGGLGAGPHRIALAPARPLAAGVYLLRLAQQGEVRLARGLVVR